MKVTEKFISINGEGLMAGAPAAFVRFAGCNLDCSYCDTRWANVPDCPYDEVSKEKIIEWVNDTGVKNVTLTGGEPLLQEGIEDLTAGLLTIKDMRVEIETNGSIDLTFLRDRFANVNSSPCITMDYKLPSSGFESYMRTENFQLLGSLDAVKFVSGDVNDLERAYDIITRFDLLNKCNVLFSPVFGKIDPKDIVAFILEKKLMKARVQLQLHKFIWDPSKRGV